MIPTIRMLLRVVAAVVLAIPIVIIAADPAAAFELTTDYPTISVAPGDDVDVDLDISSTTTERVALAIVDAPGGWATRLTGGGFEIGAVFTDPDTPPPVTLEVTVPPDAPGGRQPVVVRGESGGQIRDLLLEFDVAPDAPGAFEMTTEFDQLLGGGSDTFRFDFEVDNRSTRPAEFRLGAIGPADWIVNARPTAEQQAAVLRVEPGATGTFQVEADPPDGAAAGTYPIRVVAEGAGTSLEAEVQVEIEGSVDLSFTTATERLNAEGVAGDVTEISLVVSNAGTAPLQDLAFSATPPSGWEVEFSPESVDVLPPGETATITARVRPDGDAVAGDYALTLRASGGGQNEAIDVRFSVNTSGWWGLLGVAIIVGAVGALLLVYRRFGRR